MSSIAPVLLLAAALEVGPAVGEKIPSFQAADQEGRVRTFADLRGPKGLVLLFFRSADW
jgi:peroxiredoxin